MHKKAAVLDVPLAKPAAEKVRGNSTPLYVWKSSWKAKKIDHVRGS